jgi:hypothetical protein
MVMMERDGNAAAGQSIGSERKEEVKVGDKAEGIEEGKRSRWSWFR